MLAAGLVVACVANGLVFWARRTGLLEVPGLAGEVPGIPDLPLLYALSGPLLLTKHLKDLYLVAICAAAISFAIRERSVVAGDPIRRTAVAGTVAGLALAVALGLWRLDPVLVLLQVRTLLLVALTLAFLAVRPAPSTLAWIGAAPLLAQAPFLVVEALAGAPVFHSDMPFNRLAGTFLQPSVLGTCGVVAAMLAARVHGGARAALAGVAAGGVAAVLSGSGTAWVLVLVSGAWTAIDAVPRRLRPWATAAAGTLAVLLVPLLPWLTSRPLLFDSLFGRLATAASRLPEDGPLVLLLGHGLGAGTNVRPDLLAGLTGGVIRAETTAEWLVHQFGLLGATAVTLVALRGLLRDEGLRLIHLLVILAGVTLKVPQVFPLNLLAAWLLARAIALPSSGRWGRPSRPPAA